MASFSTIPTLRLADARSPDTKPAFLAELRSALLNVGFLYLSHTGIPEPLIGQVVRECHAFFEILDDADKLQIEMKNERSFLGYSRLGNEVTAGHADWREQLDLVRPPDPLTFQVPYARVSKPQLLSFNPHISHSLDSFFS